MPIRRPRWGLGGGDDDPTRWSSRASRFTISAGARHFVSRDHAGDMTDAAVNSIRRTRHSTRNARQVIDWLRVTPFHDGPLRIAFCLSVCPSRPSS